MRHRNAIGNQVQKFRNQRKWSQERLAAKLQLIGWNVSRDVIAKIELRSRGVDDYWLYYFAHIFKVNFADLFPPIHPHSKDMGKALGKFME